MVVWMEVTQDKYELPLVVADSSVELARIVGVTKNHIYSRMSHYNNGRYKTSRFVKVVIYDAE